MRARSRFLIRQILDWYNKLMPYIEHGKMEKFKEEENVPHFVIKLSF